MSPYSLLAALLLGAPAVAQIPPGYYDTVDTQSPQALRASLHAVIDDHVRLPYTSSAVDTWDVLEAADTDPLDPTAVRTVYRAASYPKAGGGNPFYDREHSWPSSYGFPLDGPGNYPYSDCHALFIADIGYNSERSNKPYRYCDPSCFERPIAGGATGVYPGTSNWTSGFQSSGTWEARLAKRGDVARAVLYMDVRYEGGLHGATGFSEPDLVATDDAGAIAASNTGGNEPQAFMGLLSVLLEWHAADPPDTEERARCDLVFGFQGNRNPFVDHPEWVALLYGGTGGPTARPWINELHYDNAGADVGEFCELAGPEGYDLAGHRLVPYNGADGMQDSDLDLAGVFGDQGGCLGTLAFDFDGLQNGAPDGLALVDPLGEVLEFVSWEGSFTALDGPALGLTSVDLGVAEDGTTPVGHSLRRTGSGTTGTDFAWQPPAPASPGAPNAGQTFERACSGPPPVPAPENLDAIACGGQVELSWDSVAVANLVGYDLYRSGVSGSGYMKLNGAPLAATAFVDVGLFAGQTAYYVVTAIDAIEGTSEFSAELAVTAPGGSSSEPWINEFHYDNASIDAGEFVEIAGPAGLDLAGWTVIAVNGSSGSTYDAIGLTGTLPDEGECTGALAFDFPDLQNGAPDGLALIDSAGALIEFLSYEGAFTASSGAAGGAVSTDVGVSESGSTPIGSSLARTGSGSSAADFTTWAGPAPATRGTVNSGQTFAGGCNTGIEPYGCGLNPAGSLLVDAPPTVGQPLTLSLSDPTASMPPGSPGLLAISRHPAPGFPCGLPLAGFAMDSALLPGELLVDLAPTSQVGPLLTTTPLGPAGAPATAVVPIPLACTLVGRGFYVQGLLIDPTGSLGAGLSEALELEVRP